MELSRDIAVDTTVKRRGRKPASASQATEKESTIMDESDKKSEVKGRGRSRKSKDESEVPKCTIRQKTMEESKGAKSLKPDHPTLERSESSSLSLGYGTGMKYPSDVGLPEAIPATGYEWLGIRSSEPSSRPPILRLTRENEQRVAWAGKDCSLSGAVIRRVRPFRSLEGTFFDRLELLRRVALSEAAKARDPMEAVAALGIVFDREMLLLGAEEVYGATKGDTMVLEASPGSYEELAARIASDRRPKRFTRKRESLH